MTKIEDILGRYDMKAEKNATNDGIALDPLRKCTLFNESQNKFLTLHLQNRGIDDVRYIEKFLTLDKKILPSSTTYGKYNFILPKNYFDLSDVRARAEKNKCKDFIELEEIQTENLNQVMYDEFNKPSFNWRIAPYTINSNQLSIYTDDFSISDILLNYYRYPNQIRLINENNPESDYDENYPIEWDDKSLDDIITLMVFNNDINQNNPRYQLQTLRLQK